MNSVLSESPVLAVRDGGHLCAVPLAQVAEVMRPLPLEQIAGSPASVAGLALIRGQATPVIDLASLLGDAPKGEAGAAGSARFVTLRVGERRIGLRVEAVLGIRTLASAQFTALPPLWQGTHPPAVAALAALDRELFIVLETARLLPSEPAGPGQEAGS